MHMQKYKILRSGITHANNQAVLDEISHRAHTREGGYVCFANVHMTVEAHQDEDFNRVLDGAAIVAPDGKPLSVFMQLFYQLCQERIPGPDLMLGLFARATQDGLAVFFYGSTPDILDALEQQLKADYPGLKIAGTISPPFRDLTEDEDEAFIQQIVQSGAQIVFVGLGCPKQERWMQLHAAQIPAVLLGVGAAFPFYTGHVRRSPVWLQKMGLEWLYRLSQEPSRLIKRYLVTNTIFIILIFRQWLTLLMDRNSAAGRYEPI